MFDMNQINKRYFDVKLSNGLFLSVECPKLKTLRVITEVTKEKGNEMKGLIEALSLALSKNKQRKEISVEFIENNFDFDEISTLLTKYFEWVNNVKKNPN